MLSPDTSILTSDVHIVVDFRVPVDVRQLNALPFAPHVDELTVVCGQSTLIYHVGNRGYVPLRGNTSKGMR